MSLLKVQNLSFSYGTHPLLESVNFDLKKGEVVALLGPNGAGKTTLLKILLGLLKAPGSQILINGSPLRKNLKRLGYVPQYLNVNPDFPITVEKVIRMGRLGLKSTESENVKRILDVARSLELEELLDNPFGTLSGGQKQRVMIARALVTEAEILLLDEPTANVDMKSARNLTDILAELKKNAGVLFVTHDVSFVSSVTDRVVCLHGSASVHQTSAITPELLEQVFGRGVQWVHHHGDHDHD